MAIRGERHSLFPTGLSLCFALSLVRLPFFLELSSGWDDHHDERGTKAETSQIRAESSLAFHIPK
jgi:hypothetical protein